MFCEVNVVFTTAELYRYTEGQPQVKKCDNKTAEFENIHGRRSQSLYVRGQVNLSDHAVKGTESDTQGYL